MKVDGQLYRAQLECRASDLANTITGAIWYRTDTQAIKVATGSSILTASVGDADGASLQRSGDVWSVKDLGVTAAKLAASAVETAKINDLAVTTAKIDALAVTSAKIGANAVMAGKLADGAVDTTARLADGIVTQAKRATATGAISSSCGSVNYTGASRQDVANLSVTITCSGRPVLLMLMGHTSGSGLFYSDGGANSYLYFVRTSTDLTQFIIQAGNTTRYPGSAWQFIDTAPGTGSITFKVNCYPDAGGYIYFEDVKLVAVEL